MLTTIKKRKFLLLGLLSCIFLSGWYQTSPDSKDEKLTKTILPLYKMNDNGQLECHGTGFLAYKYNDSNSLIVTCGHLVKDNCLYIQIPLSGGLIKAENLKDSNKLATVISALEARTKSEWYYDGKCFFQIVSLEENKTYISTDSLDIAVIKCHLLKDRVIIGKDTISVSKKMVPFVISETRCAYELNAGDDLYFMGFPLGIASHTGLYNSKKYSDDTGTPVLRTAVMSWKSNDSQYFLIEGLSYDGSSGSPIVTKGPAGAQRLVGIVLGHIVAKEDRFKIYNIGLVECIDIKYVFDLINKI